MAEVLRSARKTLSSCVQCLGQQKQLASELFILTRLTYMKHGQLRREKSFQGLKQIRACVQKFFAMGLEKSVKEMNSHFEDAVVEEGIRVYLPSRQMWQHLLTQLMGAAALLANTASRCGAVFLHVHRHLTAGMLIPTNLVFLSTLSRIWACCQGLCRELQSWYQSLIPVTNVLQSTDVAWLPEGESLPTDLSAWLMDQGFSSGLDAQRREGEEEDTLATLMAKYQTEEQNKNKDMSTQPEDSTAPRTVEEDLGDPVDISEVTMISREEDPADASSLRTKTGVKEKIMAATTIHDLQLILTKFQKKRPESCTKKKIGKCSNILADLQSRSQSLEGKGKEARVQKLLLQARKHLINFFKTVARENQADTSLLTPNSSGIKVTKKNTKDQQKPQKNVKRGKKVAVDNVDKGQSVSDTKNKKKQKKNAKSGRNVLAKKRQLDAASADHKPSLACRKRKKNDPVNNQMKAVQKRQKKKKGRKV